jgi:hypothetical protein
MREIKDDFPPGDLHDISALEIISFLILGLATNLKGGDECLL